MEIKDSNRMIAEFMGGTYLRKKDPFDGRVIEYIRFEKGVFRDMVWNGSQGACEDSIEALLYHRYWDWIMPVVKKIESGVQRDVVIYDLCCRIEDPASKKVWMGAGATKIEGVYSAVVAFIQFYNSTKNTTDEG